MLAVLIVAAWQGTSTPAALALTQVGNGDSYTLSLARIGVIGAVAPADWRDLIAADLRTWSADACMDLVTTGGIAVVTELAFRAEQTSDVATQAKTQDLVRWTWPSVLNGDASAASFALIAVFVPRTPADR